MNTHKVTGGGSAMHTDADATRQHGSGGSADDVSGERTVRMSPASLPKPPAPGVTNAPLVDASTVALRPPQVVPDGGLTTRIGEPVHAEHAAHMVRAAQERAQEDVASVGSSFAEIAAALHEHTATLERFVEGPFSTDLSDPRTRLLSQSLELARQNDLRLARLGHTLQRLDTSVRVAQSNLDALQRERERLSTLYHIAQELNSQLELEDLLGRVMALLIEVVRAERGFLMLWDGDAGTGRLQFTAARGADGHPLAEEDFCISQGVVDGVWQSQQPLLTVDAQEDARLHEHVSVVAYGIRSVMCAPLRVRGHGVGIVYVDSRNQAALFDASHLDLLAAFCNQAAIAIDNARLFADLRRRIREISEMKSYMEDVFASIASGVITADTGGVVTAFNRAAEHIFDFASDRALGQSYRTVFTGIADAELEAIMTRATRENAVTLGHEVERTLPGRGDVSLRLNVSPLRASEGEGEALGVAMVVDDLTELRRSQRQAREIQRLFGRYVHPAVVRQLLADPSAVHLGGETREISIVFADIRGYTRLAEENAQAELVSILNGYLNILTEAVWQEEGTVTMFIGDALMAIFNAPLSQADHARRAVRAAWAMRQALEHHRATLGPNAVPVEYGIGVHTGLAVVGNIGARDRLQNYTAIGDAVNTAQRLQANATNNQVLLSAAIYAEVAPAVLAHELEPLRVKGKTQPLSVYQLDGLRAG